MEWAVATRLKVWRAHVVFGADSVEDRKDKRAHNTGLSKLHRLSPLRFLGLVVTRKSSNLGELRLRKSTRRGPPDKYLPRLHTQHGTLESGGRWGTGEEHAVYSTRLAARRDMRIAGKRRYLPSRSAQVSLSKKIAFAESSARNRTDEP